MRVSESRDQCIIYAQDWFWVCMVHTLYERWTLCCILEESLKRASVSAPWESEYRLPTSNPVHNVWCSRSEKSCTGPRWELSLPFLSWFWKRSKKNLFKNSQFLDPYLNKENFNTLPLIPLIPLLFSIHSMNKNYSENPKYTDHCDNKSRPRPGSVNLVPVGGARCDDCSLQNPPGNWESNGRKPLL